MKRTYPPHMTLATLAEYLDLTEKAVRRLHEDGKLPNPKKAGRRVLYAKADIDAWLDGDGGRTEGGDDG